MSEQEKEQRLEQLLDSLLAAYTDVEPRPGLETRLLANLRAEAAAPLGSRFHLARWLSAVMGVLVLAAAVFVIYVSRVEELPPPPQIRAAGLPVLPLLPPVAPPRGSQAQMRRKEIAPPAVEDVRQATFPTPSPLSDQEKLLLRYLAGTPKEEIAAQSHPDEPAEPVDPLVPESQQRNGNDVQSVR